MIPQINIISVVDVIGALASGTLKNNLFMMDNRRGIRPGGGIGTDALTTNATYTQVLNWHVMAIDFQTDVQINKITFYQNGIPITVANTPCARLQKYGAPSGHYWAGVINYPESTKNGITSGIKGGIYQYLIEFDIGRKIITADSFSLINISA